MNTKSLFTRSAQVASRIKYAAKSFLIISLLAGISLAFVPTAQASSNRSAKTNAIVQPYETMLLAETYSDSLPSRGPGRDFGAIDYSAYSFIKQLSIQNPFVYWYAGQMVVRRSELGPLTDSTSNSIPLHTPGHDFDAQGFASIPNVNLRASRLPFEYKISGRLVTRFAEFGNLADPADISLLENALGQYLGYVSNASDPDMSQCTPRLPISYTIAGQTVIRHSELGPLAGPLCSPFLTNTP